MGQDPEETESASAGGASAGLAVAPDEAAVVPPEAAPAPVEKPPPAAGDPVQLEQRARLAEDRLGEVLAAYRKAKLDNEGFRDRLTQQLERRQERRHEALLLRFIEVLDNFDRALEAAERCYTGNPLIDGLILVRTQLLQILRGEGLERIPVLGLPFDPSVSEAVGVQAISDPDHDNAVVRELSRGYRLNGRIARVSRVMVGAYGAEAAAAAGEPLIGVDEFGASYPTASGSDPAAATIRIDEAVLREVFDKPDDTDEG